MHKTLQTVNKELNTASLDNAIQEFSLAQPSWYMSHYISCSTDRINVTRECLERFYYCVTQNNSSLNVTNLKYCRLN